MDYKKIFLSFLSFLVLLLVIFSLSYFFSTKEDLITKNPTLEENISSLNQKFGLNVVLVGSEEERIKGLSGTKTLLPDQGMLFVFDKPDFYDIWMKEMNFPIDIIWLDDNFVVVDIKNDATPESFPEIFRSRGKSSYVLEVHSNFIEEKSIRVGERL